MDTSIVDFKARVRAIGLSLDEVIVIGSGALDMRGIRHARDVDLVVTPTIFKQLEQTGDWSVGARKSHTYSLVNRDREVWMDWSTDGTGHPNYNDLLASTELIDGIRVVTLDYLMVRKAERGTQKDLADISLIKQYLGDR